MNIKDKYYDALFFASASQNEKELFYLTGGEFRFLIKLIHYSNKQKNITWTSEQISEHLWMTPAAINSLVKKLRVKGYIYTSSTQISEKVKTRTIWINWDFISKIDSMIDKVEIEVLNESIPQVEPIPQKEEKAPINEEKVSNNENKAILSNMKKDELIEKYRELTKWAPKGTPLCPAEFHKLTNNHFAVRNDISALTLKTGSEEGFKQVINELLNKEFYVI